MDDSWLTLILLGLTASFMPLIFSTEIYLLGGDDGAQKVSSLLGGVTIFRLVVAFISVLVMAGVLASLSQGLSNIGQFLSSLLTQVDQDITSGQHLVVDLLLIAAGATLIIQAVRHARGGSNAAQTSDADDAKALNLGIAGMLGMGVLMTATNVQQWLLISTGVNQILRTQSQHLSRLLAFLLFLVLATALIALPLVVYLVRPEQAGSILGRVNDWINGSMRYVVAIILSLIGLYFIGKGVVGLSHFLAG